ncbi:hypothetical protein WKW80_17225 [Variovorax humicola]|uniref:Uncharacterized protein n=1 Tax=Variovorax humicola TaxID=1769758 RepID=A0ABU8W172_9BURK
MSRMQHPSTDPQTFSSFVSLNRADRTHQPKEAPLSKERIASFVIAGIVAAIAICMLLAAR